ncbi:MAG TPA: hypothetical protein PLV05_01885 [Verrucomicrobiota bacterium]|nr:hypothetical protein [Verrucomicrobiota bacterium]HPL35738.1 hypothetical protein [Verrucomicrobiota bacterium]HRV39056.1 hypothetical protein [Candidatus Paceibacterota bacterium]
MAQVINTPGELQRMLDEHLLDAREFFTEGACWAFAYALSRDFSAQAYLISNPVHVWIEHNGRAYDAKSSGLPRQEMLRRLLNGPYAHEKAEQESRRLAMECKQVEITELPARYRPEKSLSRGVYEIPFEVAMGYTEKAYDLPFATTRFRFAIESCDKSLLPITFRDFPSGSCGDAALLLGCYLRERGLGEFEHVTGERGVAADGTWQSHAWLERNGVFVDITSDQFNELAKSVQVGHQRHRQNTFEVTGRHRADFRAYDERTSSILEGAYKSILGQFLSPKPAAGK